MYKLIRSSSSIALYCDYRLYMIILIVMDVSWLNSHLTTNSLTATAILQVGVISSQTFRNSSGHFYTKLSSSAPINLSCCRIPVTFLFYQKISHVSNICYCSSHETEIQLFKYLFAVKSSLSPSSDIKFVTIEMPTRKVNAFFSLLKTAESEFGC